MTGWAFPQFAIAAMLCLYLLFWAWLLLGVARGKK